MRDGCGRKETQINLTDFLSGSGGSEGGGGEPEIDRSGSRLHVRYFVGADGSREFIGFLDTQRNEHCSFTWVGYRAEDGTTRCLPQENLASLSESYFADSSCTQPLTSPGGALERIAPGRRTSRDWSWTSARCSSASTRSARSSPETSIASSGRWVAAGDTSNRIHDLHLGQRGPGIRLRTGSRAS